LRQVQFAPDALHLGTDHLSCSDNQLIACFRVTISAIGAVIPLDFPALPAFPASEIIYAALHAFDTQGLTATLEMPHSLTGTTAETLPGFHGFFSLKEITGAPPAGRYVTLM
jgi:hypothetical protein